MSGDFTLASTTEIATGVGDWLRDLARLLQCIERVVEQVEPSHDAPIEVKTLLPLLLPLIRQCRSQVPTDQMVEVWVRTIQERGQHSPRLRGSAEEDRFDPLEAIATSASALAHTH